MTIPLLWFSALSFLGYGISCVFTDHMKEEFERFGLAGQRLIVGWTQVIGAIGLLLGIQFPIVGIVSAGGLALQMLLGVGVRVKIGDTILQTLPALIYFLLNAFLFFDLISH